MDDPAFTMSVLDFNLHFLGFRSEKLKMPDGGPESLFNGALPEYYSTYPSAIESAKNVANNGDYLAILGLGTTTFMPPIPSGKIMFGTFEFDIDEGRKNTFDQQLSLLSNLKTLAENTPRLRDFCAVFSHLRNSIPFDSFPDQAWNWARQPLEPRCAEVDGSDEQEPSNNGTSEENPSQDDSVLPSSVIAEVTETERRFKTVHKYYNDFLKINYQPKTVLDLVSIDLKKFDAPSSEIKLRNETWFWQTFRNSSTNMNRKRAAYVLKRFFCDDLTPIGIEAPETHANGDRHGTDPGCQSCHYKLDPMAGFFRNIGAAGVDSTLSETIYFDDGASKNRSEYNKQWRNADDTAWNVGYIRSVTNQDINDKPSGDPGIQELFEIIRNAPEVKQCIVKNLFAYLVGEEVTLDRGYLTELTQKFTELAATNSSEALKQSIKSIVMSQSFIKESPEKGVCYDFASGYDSDGKPPCEVAYVLSNSCEQCHSATNNQGGLDVSTWTKGKGFTHVDADGNEIAFHESLRRIDERLVSSDVSKRMPLTKHMSSYDRDLLYRWVKSEMEKK